LSPGPVAASVAAIDGWGHREETDQNAIAAARTPVWDPPACIPGAAVAVNDYCEERAREAAEMLGTSTGKSMAAPADVSDADAVGDPAGRRRAGPH